MNDTSFAMFIKIFVKMLSSPLAVIGIIAQLAFMGIWMVYGFVPAMVYWVIFSMLGFCIPKRLLDKYLKVVLESVDGI